MRRMLVHITKRTDGGALLRCARGDGSSTWQKQQPRRAAFFPLHDLTHYAVEVELGLGSGFYGLIARGWDIDDTTGNGPRGPLPTEAIVVEHLVGQLDLERTTGVTWTAAELNAHAAEYFRQRSLPTPRALTDADLTRIRARLRDLYARWGALRPGDTLELSFDIAP